MTEWNFNMSEAPLGETKERTWTNKHGTESTCYALDTYPGWLRI